MDIEIISNLGYLGLFIWSAVDHTGTPAALLIGTSLAVQGTLDIKLVLIYSFLGAVFSDIFLYYLAYFLGYPLIIKLKRIFPVMTKPYNESQLFVEKYGVQTIIWGRFLAVISRYLPIVFGILRVAQLKYIIAMLIGNILMNVVIGYAIFLFWESFSVFLNDKNIILYISIGIIAIQIVVTILFIKYRKFKKN
ncbi:VTT domain-containing protein [uncultured Dokdonia sp.]|uniref:DedA family protein n=1 Tax=uncultured Dokdonia sp. TaxID=575653 RepID=UPI0026378F6E|nr:VTT domain-containing protein [uncultured Dokdonia sp.]